MGAEKQGGIIRCARSINNASLERLYKLFGENTKQRVPTGIWLMFEVYDLNALIAAEIQVLEQLALFGFHGG